jgi:hypothetical protein
MGELEHLAGGLIRGEAGALEAAGSLTDIEREYVSSAMRGQTAAAREDPAGTLGVAEPTAEPDYDFASWLDYGRRRGYFRDGTEPAPSSSSESPAPAAGEGEGSAPGSAEPDATGAE